MNANIFCDRYFHELLISWQFTPLIIFIFLLSFFSYTMWKLDLSQREWRQANMFVNFIIKNELKLSFARLLFPRTKKFTCTHKKVLKNAILLSNEHLSIEGCKKTFRSRFFYFISQKSIHEKFILLCVHVCGLRGLSVFKKMLSMILPTKKNVFVYRVFICIWIFSLLPHSSEDGWISLAIFFCDRDKIWLIIETLPQKNTLRSMS